MKKTTLAIGLAALALPVGTALSADALDLGKLEYEANCQVCHAANGKGGGSYAELLKTKVPDLTTLAKANNGVFPTMRVYEVIDGRKAVKAHGTREMPIWGRAYATKAAGYYVDVPYDQEAFVRGRILALIDYLNRMQAK